MEEIDDFDYDYRDRQTSTAAIRHHQHPVSDEDEDDDGAVAMMGGITPTSSADDDPEQHHFTTTTDWQHSSPPRQEPMSSFQRRQPSSPTARAASHASFDFEPSAPARTPDRFKSSRPQLSSERHSSTPRHMSRDQTPRAQTPSVPVTSRIPDPFRPPSPGPSATFSNEDLLSSLEVPSVTPRANTEEDFIHIPTPSSPRSESSQNGRAITSTEVSQQLMQVLKETGKLSVLMGKATAEWWLSPEMQARRRAAGKVIVDAGSVVATGAGNAIMNGTPLGRVSRGVAEEVEAFRGAPLRYAARGLGLVSRDGVGGSGAQNGGIQVAHDLLDEGPQRSVAQSGQVHLGEALDDDDGADFMATFGDMGMDDDDDEFR